MGGKMDVIVDSNGNLIQTDIDKSKGYKKPYIGNSLSDFEIVKFLGKGKFGHVNLVKSKITQKFYAMKELELEQGNIKSIQKEVKLLESLHHPNTINYYTSFKENNNYYIIIEYMNGKTLETVIEENIKNNIFLEEKKIWELLIQCLNGIFYLHINKKIIHRDIKPDNLILDKDNVLKISDFGVSAIDSNDVDDFIKFKKRIGEGPFRYLAPEVIDKKPYDFKNDLFMLGMTFFYLSSNQKYLDRENVNGKIITKYTNATFPDIYSEELKNYIYNLLKDVNERPNTEKAFLEAITIYSFKYLKSCGVMSLIFCFFSIKNIEKFFNSNDISVYIKKNQENNQYLYINLFKKALCYADENYFNYDELNKICLRLLVLFQYKKEIINVFKEIPLGDFINFLLNSLNKELNKNPELIKSSLNQELIDGTNEEEVINDILNKLQKNNSKISDEFSYISKVVNKCLICDNDIKYSSSIDYICYLYPDRAADYLNKKNLDIHDLFLHYIKKRKYGGENIFCNFCLKNQKDVNKIKTFYNFPKNLILYLSYAEKDKFEIDINEIIDIKNFVQQNNNRQIEYILSGVVLVELKGKEKVYSSISKNKNGDWRFFDGKDIHPSSFNNLKNHKNFKILVYSYLE